MTASPEEGSITNGSDPGMLESQRIESPYGKVPDTYKHELIVEPIMGDVKLGSSDVTGTNRSSQKTQDMNFHVLCLLA